jgi:Uncharacterized protein containing LysM domain
MERIAFLLPPDDRQLFCMLNPESVIVHRRAGVSSRPTVGAAGGSHEQSPASLAFNGSQMTIVDLRLLFDVSLSSGPGTATEDVRQTTCALFALAGPSDEGSFGSPGVLRMIWGTSWNLPCVIMEIAERLDYFNEYGEPRRSWLSMRALVVDEETETRAKIEVDAVQSIVTGASLDRLAAISSKGGEKSGESTMVFTDRLDAIAAKVYGDSGLWRALAEYNSLVSISPTEGKQILRIPSKEMLMKAAGNVR